MRHMTSANRLHCRVMHAQAIVFHMYLAVRICQEGDNMPSRLAAMLTDAKDILQHAKSAKTLMLSCCA